MHSVIFKLKVCNTICCFNVITSIFIVHSNSQIKLELTNQCFPNCPKLHIQQTQKQGIECFFIKVLILFPKEGILPSVFSVDSTTIMFSSNEPVSSCTWRLEFGWVLMIFELLLSLLLIDWDTSKCGISLTRSSAIWSTFLYR